MHTLKHVLCLYLRDVETPLECSYANDVIIRGGSKLDVAVPTTPNIGTKLAINRSTREGDFEK